MDTPRCDQTEAWAALQGHYQAHGRDFDLREAFARDPGRFDTLAVEAPHVFADLSKNRIDSATLHFLLDLARECRVEQRRDALLRGDPVNTTEPLGRQAVRIHTVHPGDDVDAELFQTGEPRRFELRHDERRGAVRRNQQRGEPLERTTRLTDQVAQIRARRDHQTGARRSLAGAIEAGTKDGEVGNRRQC